MKVEITGNLRIGLSWAGWDGDLCNQGSELGGIKTGKCLGNQSQRESRLEGLGPGRVEMEEGVTRGWDPVGTIRDLGIDPGARPGGGELGWG